MWRNTSRTQLKQSNKKKKIEKKAENAADANANATVNNHNKSSLIFGGGWQGLSTPYGPDLSEVTYFTVLRLLSETIGKLPVYVRDKNHNIIDNNINFRLSKRPNENDTPATFFSYMEFNRTHYGNAYCYCKWNEKTGELDGIYPLDPHRVRIWVDNVSDPVVIKHFYSYENTMGKSFFLPNEDICHLKTWHCDSLTGIVGIPVRETLQEYMDAAKGGQRTQNDMYKAGMVASGVLNFVGDMKDPLIEEMIDYTKKIGKSQRIIPLPENWKLTPINLSLADSQYLETRKYTALQVAAAYGVSPNQLNDYSKGSYSNSVAQEIAFLTQTLQYISRVYETEMSIKLLSDEDIKAGVHIDVDTDAMLQNTPETLANIVQKLAGGSVMTINEGRDLMHLPPVPNGDEIVKLPGAQSLGGNNEKKSESN